MTFEGQQLQGSVKIAEKLAVSEAFYNINTKYLSKMHIAIYIYVFFSAQSLTFKKIDRVITAIDSQPTFDGGVIINVIGRLRVCIA